MVKSTLSNILKLSLTNNVIQKVIVLILVIMTNKMYINFHFKRGEF